MSEQRISADVHSNARKDGMVIELPIRPGGIKTVVVLVLGDDGRLHVSGPLTEPNLMASILKRAEKLLRQYHRTALVQPVMAMPGMKGGG